MCCMGGVGATEGMMLRVLALAALAGVWGGTAEAQLYVHRLCLRDCLGSIGCIHGSICIGGQLAASCWTAAGCICACAGWVGNMASNGAYRAIFVCLAKISCDSLPGKAHAAAGRTLRSKERHRYKLTSVGINDFVYDSLQSQLGAII